MSEFKEEYKEKHNRVRRLRYARDPEYRERAKKQQMKTYRKNMSYDKCKRVGINDLEELKKIGQMRKVKKAQVLSFSVDETSIVLGGYPAQTIRRWLTTGLLPKMIHRGRGENDRLDKTFYTIDEIMPIADIMVEHQKTYCYYSKKNITVKAKIKKAVSEVRNKK